MAPRILTLDIETFPNLGYFYGLWKQNIGIGQVEEFTELACFAAKWRDERSVMFFRGEGMVESAHQLLSEADIVVTYNGDNFDLKHLNREFWTVGLPAPEPYASVDLLKQAKKNFRFASNKLDHVAQVGGVGAKLHHTGFDLWLGCMKDDPKAWALMERYNKQDVRITEKLYGRMLPWIKPHPSVPMLEGRREGCPNCGSLKSQKRGYAYTATSKFQQYQCNACGKWYRGSSRLDTPTARVV